MRAPNAAALGAISSALGSNFDMRIARALRTRGLLCVEGDDPKILRRLAVTLGADRVASERDITVIPIKGFSHWTSVDPLRWLSKEILGTAVPMLVTLDRDYHTPAAIKKVTEALGACGVGAHVWERKEIESYLIDPDVIARLTGADADWVRKVIDNVALSLRVDVQSRIVSALQKEAPSGMKEGALLKAMKDTEAQLSDIKTLRGLCPAKDILAGLNTELQKSNRKAFTVERLAAAFRQDEIQPEVARVIDRANALGDSLA